MFAFFKTIFNFCTTKRLFEKMLLLLFSLKGSFTFLYTFCSSSGFVKADDLFPFEEYKSKYFLTSKKNRGFAEALVEVIENPTVRHTPAEEEEEEEDNEAENDNEAEEDKEAKEHSQIEAAEDEDKAESEEVDQEKEEKKKEKKNKKNKDEKEEIEKKKKNRKSKDKDDTKVCTLFVILKGLVT